MERVVNVSVGDHHRLYPFSVLDGNPIINDVVQGIPIVIFSKDDAASALDKRNIAESRIIPSATVFRRQTADHLLTFESRDGRYFDIETGSEWNLFGQAIAGRLKGEKLDDIDNGLHFAFAWLAFHPQSEIVTEVN